MYTVLGLSASNSFRVASHPITKTTAVITPSRLDILYVYSMTCDGSRFVKAAITNQNAPTMNKTLKMQASIIGNLFNKPTDVCFRAACIR